jgi:hypothetical protein
MMITQSSRIEPRVERPTVLLAVDLTLCERLFSVIACDQLAQNERVFAPSQATHRFIPREVCTDNRRVPKIVPSCLEKERQQCQPLSRDRSEGQKGRRETAKLRSQLRPTQHAKTGVVLEVTRVHHEKQRAPLAFRAAPLYFCRIDTERCPLSNPQFFPRWHQWVHARQFHSTLLERRTPS